jgi:hypothetical protein
MKISALFLTAVATAVLASTGLAANYEAFVKEGYRWATADGPFACPAKGDLQEIIKHSGDDEVPLQMVEQLRAYYLVRGTMVKVVQEEPASGLAEIQIAGITTDLWTLSRFLSTRPIPDVYGAVETPATSGFLPTATPEIREVPSDAVPASGTTSRSE